MKMKIGMLVLVGIAICAILLASVSSVVSTQFFGDANKDDAINTKDFDRVVIPVGSDFMKGNILNKGMAPTASIMYEGLVTKNSWEDTYDCWLADSWEVSEDAKVWTFHLVKNATWHDGEPFTSEDVKFTHDYIKSKKLWLSWVISRVDYVECPDDYTAIFYLKTSYPAFLDELSHCPGIPIVPEHIWQNIDDPEHYKDNEFIGTGPFKFKNRIPGQYFVLETNENYHGTKPHVKEVVFKVISNKDSQILALKSGDVDALSGISPAVANMLKDRENIEIYSAPDVMIFDLGFNVKSYPSNITAFRKAMVHAIDREKICNTIFSGCARPMYTTFLMPSVAHDFVNPDTPKYDYDLAETKRLLKSAGFDDIDGDGKLEGPDGKDVTITIPTGGTAAGVWGYKIAEVLKNDWKELGIEVTIKQLEHSQWFKEIHKSPVWIFQIGYLNHDDPDDLSHFGSEAHFGDPNWHDYNNPAYDRLIEEIRSTADREKRNKIGYKMQEVLANDVPSVSICSADKMFAYRSDRFVGWEWEDVHPLSWWLEDIKILLNVKSVRDNISEEEAITQNESEGEGSEQKIPVNLCDLLIAIIVATSISIATRKRR